MLATGSSNELQGRLAAGFQSQPQMPSGGGMSPFPFGGMGGSSAFGGMPGGFMGSPFQQQPPQVSPQFMPSSAASMMGGVSPSFSPFQLGGMPGGGGSMYNFSMGEGTISTLGFNNMGHPLSAANSAANSVFGEPNLTSKPIAAAPQQGVGRTAVGMGTIQEEPAVRPADPPPPARAPRAARPGPGMHWMIRNNKMIVSGFLAGSVAREKGVLAGDILRKVDQVDVLQMVKNAEGRHPAIDLLLGQPGSVPSPVSLTLLRVNKPAPGQATTQHPLLEFTVTLPRRYPPGQEPSLPSRRPPPSNSGCSIS